MNIANLLKEDNSGVLLLVSPLDLKEFALNVIDEYKQQLPQDEKKYTPREFAKRHGVRPETLWRWCNAGILRKTVIGGKVYYKDSDLKVGKI